MGLLWEEGVQVRYSEFVTHVQGGNVSTVLFKEDSPIILYRKRPENCQLIKNATQYSRKIGVAQGPENCELFENKWQYSTRKIGGDESFLLNLMREKGVVYSSAPQSEALLVWGSILMSLAMVALVFFVYRKLRHSPKKPRKPSNCTLSFNDVEGIDAAKKEIMEIVLCLKGAPQYMQLNAKLPRGVLLVGPPGTGKTLLARAMANEAQVPFFPISASEFVECFVGLGASRVRKLFEDARKSAPSVIFIDEIDSVGGQRGHCFNEERDQTLNQLLTEMDGFDSDVKIVVIAATNRADTLDPALLRSGRFSRKIFITEPDSAGRKKILAIHLKGVPLAERSVDICEFVAPLTEGFVGADLANVVHEATFLAARRGAISVARVDIMGAINRVKSGQIKPAPSMNQSIPTSYIIPAPSMNQSNPTSYII